MGAILHEQAVDYLSMYSVPHISTPDSRSAIRTVLDPPFSLDSGHNSLSNRLRDPHVTSTQAHEAERLPS